MDIQSLRQLETTLWDTADNLRANSKLTSQQYCMPVLGLIFLRYAFGRFKRVEAEILESRPVRKGRVMPVEPSDFKAKNALFLPREAQYDYLVNLPEHIASAYPATGEIGSAFVISEDGAAVPQAAENGQPVNSLGEAVNRAMQLIEEQAPQLSGILPKDYHTFPKELLADLLRNFNNSALDDVGGDVIGRIYEYFLSKFAPAVASDDGVFFTPKSLVKMIVEVLEPSSGILLDKRISSLIQTHKAVQSPKPVDTRAFGDLQFEPAAA